MEKLGRWRDLIDFMKGAIGMNSRLNREERDLLAAAYKNGTTQLRNHIRFIDSVILHQRSKGCHARVDCLTEHRQKLLSELSTTCSDVISLTERRLFPSAQTIDDKIFYLSLQGDFYRYLCEFVDESVRWEPANSANECYEKALGLARDHLLPMNPILLNLTMNYAVFIDDILDRRVDAIEESKSALKQIRSAAKSNKNATVSPQAQSAIRRIKSNIDIWTKQTREEALGLGRFAASCAQSGNIDGSCAIVRVSDAPYKAEFRLVPLKNVAGKTRRMPDEYIAPSKNNVTEAFMRYGKPLIGELSPVGLLDFGKKVKI